MPLGVLLGVLLGKYSSLTLTIYGEFAYQRYKVELIRILPHKNTRISQVALKSNNPYLLFASDLD